MENHKPIIISIVGSVGAGKSSLISELEKRLKAEKINYYSYGIDPVRKTLWEEKGKGEWSWENEDEAYGEILSQISLLVENEKTKTVIILETTGLARRMHRAHRLLSQLCPLYIVKVDCDPQICLQRHQTRNKDMSEYPPLALQNTIEEGIILMADSIRTMPADLTLDSNAKSIKENNDLLWNWISSHLNNAPKRQEVKKFPAYISKYSSEQLSKADRQTKDIPNTKEDISARLLEHQPELLEICKLIAHQVQNQQPGAKAYIASSYIREALLNKKSKRIELEVFNVNNEKLFEILNDCFSSKVRTLNRRKVSYIIFTSSGEEIRVSIAANELFLGGQIYQSPQEYAENCDFTINSILLCPLTNELIDPLSAIRDLISLTIKSPNLARYKKHPKTFIDIYRSVQLVGRYGFKLESNLKDLYRKSVEQGCLQRVSAFFTAEELNQLFDQPRFTSLAFELMFELGVLKSDFPELLDLRNQEALTKSKAWALTLARIDQSENTVVTLACMLAEIFTNEKKISVSQVEQILGIFQLPDKVVSLVAICLIQKRKLTELKKLSEKAPVSAAPTVKKIQARPLIAPKTVDNLRQPTAEFFASFWPLQLEQFLAFLDICEQRQFVEFKSFVDSLIKRYKIDPEYRSHLVTKKMLLDRFKSIQGEAISLLLSEVDKQRLYLITPESAMDYLEENFPRLINQKAN